MADPGNLVPFLDLGATYRELRAELDVAYERVMESGWYLLGGELEAFEAEFGRYVDARHCVGVGSGLDALTLSLRSLDIGPGDEVIVPSNTYIATWLAVTAVGATPVAVEPDPSTHNVDAASIAGAITSRTRAVLPVHLYGQPADLDPILELARDRNLRVIEDAAQAHGSRYRGNRVGAMGDVVCWSFYPGKNLGAFADGGAITTNRADVADRVRLLRNYGSRLKYVNEEPGVNSRLDELQAAFLRVKLGHLDDWNARRSQIAERYLEELSEIPALVVPAPLSDVTSAWHLFVVRHPKRDQLQAHLSAEGIQTLIHYPIPPHRQQAYAGLPIGRALPVAEQLATEVLSLPIGPHLGPGDVEDVIAAVKGFHA